MQSSDLQPKPMKIPFSKYEGAGNNFIMIDMTSSHYDITAEQMVEMCRWKTGVGADGVMVLKKSLLPKCRYKYVHYLPMTGMEGLLCGNGSRCCLAFTEQVGLFKFEKGGSPISFESCDGLHLGGKLSLDKYFISINDISLKNISEIEDNYYFLDVGSRHYIRFVEDINGKEVSPIGLEFRHADKSSVNFVQVMDGNVNSIAVRTYEDRMEEETLACGTGSTASAIVTFLRQHYFKNPDGRKGSAESSVTTRVSMRGGELEVQFTVGEQAVSDIRLSGPVRHVFDGFLFL